MLLKYVPTRKFLEPASFVEVKGGPKKRLWLHCNHQIKTSVGKSQYEGSAVVSYGIEVRSDHVKPAFDLRVDPTVPHCGVQSASGALDVLSELGLRSASVATAEDNLAFDMRSVSYVCGSVAAMCAAGIDPELPKLKASAVVMTPSHTLAIGSSPTYTPSAWRSTAEFSTLMVLNQLAGAEEVYLAAQSVPARGTYLEKLSLGAYACRVHANIMAEANRITAAAAHHEAFMSGAIGAMRVLGHSDEGGEIRAIMRKRSYPRPVGLVPVHMVSVMELSTTKNMRESDLCRYMVSEVLACAGRISRSDLSRVEGLSTVYMKEEKASKPSDLIGFEQDYYDVMANWRKLCSAENGLVASDTIDTSSSKRYFSEDLETNHFLGSSIAPFWYVEPGGVSISMDGGVYSLGCQGQGKEVPLLEDCEGYKSLAYVEYKGTPLSRSNVMFVFRNGYQARRNGINYLMSSAYRSDNGLSRFETVRAPELGVISDKLAMCDNLAADLAGKRWITPHCPTPNPSECITDMPVCLSYTYGSIGLQPLLSEFLSVKMDSMFGALYVGSRGVARDVLCHRDVPQELGEFLAGTAAFSFYISESAGKVDLSTKTVSPSSQLGAIVVGVDRADMPKTSTEVMETAISDDKGEDIPEESVEEQDIKVGPSTPAVKPKTNLQGSDTEARAGGK